MENCLVKKLKGVVNYDNPVYLNKVILTVDILNGYGSAEKQCYLVRDGNGQPVTGLQVETLNTDGATVRYLSDMIMIKKGTGNQVIIKMDKYPVKYFRLLNSEVNVPISQITNFFNLEKLDLIERFTGDINDIKNIKNLKTIIMTGFNTVGFNISTLAQIPSIEVINLSGYMIVGDLSAIKDMPNLTTVTLNVRVTDNDDTVTYLENRGVTVTYTPLT